MFTKPWLPTNLLLTLDVLIKGIRQVLDLLNDLLDLLFNLAQFLTFETLGIVALPLGDRKSVV